MVVGSDRGWSGWWQGEDCGEGVVEVVGPRPGFGDCEASASLTAHDACGGMQQSIAQGFGFGLGEVTGQGEQP